MRRHTLRQFARAKCQFGTGPASATTRCRNLHLPVLFAAALGAISTAPASPAAAPAPVPRTDMYHVHFAKAALGKAAELGDALKSRVGCPCGRSRLRHQDGDSLDSRDPNILRQATNPRRRAAPPTSQMAPGRPGIPTARDSGPAGDVLPRNWGLMTQQKPQPLLTVSVYRPEAGQRDAPKRTRRASRLIALSIHRATSLLQHMGAAGDLPQMVSRYNSWNDTRMINQVRRSVEEGWRLISLRNLRVSYHTDTRCRDHGADKNGLICRSRCQLGAAG